MSKKKTLSISEFKKYCDEKDFICYKYSSNYNGESIFCNGVFSVEGEYNTVVTCLKPDIVAFVNTYNNICLSSVVSIVIDEYEDYTIIDISCGLYDKASEYYETFRFIAR